MSSKQNLPQVPDVAINVLRPLPPPSAKPVKSVLRSAKDVDDPPRRMSTVQDQTTYNVLANKVGNLDKILDATDRGLIDSTQEAHKQVVESLARRVQEDPPRYAIRSLYNEFLPCLKKVNDHYHPIAVGATAEHPSLRDCDARLAWAKEYVQKTNDLI